VEELLGWLVAAVAAITAAVFAIWIAVAALIRIFAWVLVFWAIELAVGCAIGILAGVVLPPRVLRGKADEKPHIATPDAVVAGKVLGDGPKGQAKHFGWDRAWPVYNPHQAKRDAYAVLLHTKRVVQRPFDWLDGDYLPVRLAVLLPPLAGYVIGAGLSILAWCLVMALMSGLVYLIQQIGALGYRGFDRLTRLRRKATLNCSKCHRISVTPSYRCANPQCTTVHHDVRPGPLGIVHRRCGCGTTLPTTVGSAAKRLTTVCPYCSEDVPKGSGTRRVLPVPVIGSVGVGKTLFLSRGVIELAERAKQLTGSLKPVSPFAKAFMKTAADVVSARQPVTKTPWKNRPEGVPLVLSLSGRELELQLIDAAGENFVDWERSQALGYIDTADILLFILDPLALPRVTELFRVANLAGTVPIAQGDPEDSYASVIDRLRAEEVPLAAKSLAVVLTKVDVLQILPGAEGIDPNDGDSIRTWLRSNGAEGFVRRVHQDFKRVSYFAVDSHGERDGMDPLHPVRVFDWMLRTVDARLTVLPQLAAVSDGEGTI
jgi:membrane protein implicated in regulation of membrane protease activity